MSRRAHTIIKISKIGNSLGFIIDQKTIKYLKLKEDELVILELEKNGQQGKIIVKTTKLGSSLGIIVDKKMIDFLHLEFDDLIQIHIEKEKKEEEKN